MNSRPHSTAHSARPQPGAQNAQQPPPRTQHTDGGPVGFPGPTLICVSWTVPMVGASADTCQFCRLWRFLQNQQPTKNCRRMPGKMLLRPAGRLLGRGLRDSTEANPQFFGAAGTGVSKKRRACQSKGGEGTRSASRRLRKNLTVPLSHRSWAQRKHVCAVKKRQGTRSGHPKED